MFDHDGRRRWFAVGRATVSLARSEQLTFLAAAIAYYAFASVVPLILLATVAASVLVGDAFAEALVTYLGSILTPASQNVLESTLTSTAGRGSATVIGVVALLWSSLKVFRALDTSFSIVYGKGTPNSFLETVFDGVVAFAAVALAIAASTILVATLAVADAPFVAEFGAVFEIVVLTAAFYPLYLLFPDVDIDALEALPGALFAALGWTALSGLFRFYVANAASFALWGVLGAALVIVTWLYVGSLLLLLGAALNAVIAERSVLDVEPDVSAAIDRHLQSAGLRQTEPAMGDGTAGRDDDDRADAGDDAPDHAPAAEDEPPEEAHDHDDSEQGTDNDAPERDEDASDRDEVARDSPDGDPDSPDGDPDSPDGDPDSPDGDPDPAALRDEIDELKAEIASLRDLRDDVEDIEGEVDEIEDEVDDIEEDVEEFEDDVEDRTVHRDEVERDLRRYVRRRVRRGKARGWGPYLVLLYGTVMTLGAFYTPHLTGGWAIFAMIVIWLSTLGLYVLMVLAGLGANALSLPGRLRDRIGDWRS